MNNQIPIRYRGFWDVPRVFLAQHGQDTFLFDCAFDVGLDDYPDDFKVFLMPDIPQEELPKDWTLLRDRATRYLGQVAVSQVRFDPTLREFIDSQKTLTSSPGTRTPGEKRKEGVHVEFETP